MDISHHHADKFSCHRNAAATAAASCDCETCNGNRAALSAARLPRKHAIVILSVSVLFSDTSTLTNYKTSDVLSFILLQTPKRLVVQQF